MSKTPEEVLEEFKTLVERAEEESSWFSGMSDALGPYDGFVFVDNQFLTETRWGYAEIEVCRHLETGILVGTEWHRENENGTDQMYGIFLVDTVLTIEYEKKS